MRRHLLTPHAALALLATCFTGCSSKPEADGDVGDESDDGSDTGEQAGSVEIRRDEFGVPHISGTTDAAAFYGLGYVTAQDRGAQMTLSVLTVQGRLAEHFGAEHVESDRWMRVSGLWRHAQAVAGSLDADTLALLEAYSAGVNAWNAAHAGEANESLDALGLVAQEWTPAHSIAAWYRVAEYFSSDPRDKAAALEELEDLAETIGMDAAIEQLFPLPTGGDSDAAVVQASDVPESVKTEIELYAMQMGYLQAGAPVPPLRLYPHEGPKFSHAWALGGSRTSTGKAVLVSNPQVALQFPALFQEWQMSSPTIEARGAGVPGAAGLLIGFTDGVAWGLTAAGLDQRDLFALTMVDPDHYEVDGESHELVRIEETILVAGGASVTVDYTETIWGPLVTSELPGEPRGEYALRGIPWSDTDTDTVVGVIGMLRASNLDEMRAAIEHWRYPTANFVAAADESVFYTVLGAIPLRSPDAPLGGIIAQDGSTLANDWADILPDAVKPWVLDPAAGHVFSANHRIVADWYPLPLGVGMTGGGDTIRSGRLRELVEGVPNGATPAEIFASTQFDCVNAAHRDLILLGVHQIDLDPAAFSPDATATLDALREWANAGGSKETGPGEVLLASNMDIKFRPDTTGPELNEQFGGGEPGMMFFLHTLIDQIEADPSDPLDANTIAYLDDVFAGAWATTTTGSTDPLDWAGVYDVYATPSYAWFDNQELDDLGLAAPWEPGTLTCADGGTIWSQVGQTYAQHVDFAQPEGARSIMPPGATESGTYAQAQSEIWLDSEFKPAPLGASVEALTSEVEVLEYAG